jgi:hypothetical protein
MSEQAAIAGWVVEVVTLQASGGAPVFRYFNVAFADPVHAVETVRQRRDGAGANRVGAVRPLSAKEITALRLRTGTVRAA